MLELARDVVEAIVQPKRVSIQGVMFPLIPRGIFRPAMYTATDLDGHCSGDDGNYWGATRDDNSMTFTPPNQSHEKCRREKDATNDGFLLK